MAAILVALAIAAVLAAPRAHSEDNRVGLVVQYGDGSVFMGCYPWTADLTGETLLRRAGLNVEADYGSGMGALICRIGPDGCSAQDCLCQAQTPPLRYWAYWRLDRARGDWVYSQQGSSNRALQAGDVDGWAWGVGTVAFGAKPPRVTIEQVCPAPTVTPTPSLTFTVTAAPSPTRTPPAPTATTVPPPVAHAATSPTPSPAPTAAPTATRSPTSTNTPAAENVAETASATPPPTDTPSIVASVQQPTVEVAGAASDLPSPSPTSPPLAAATGATGASAATAIVTASGADGSAARPTLPTPTLPNAAAGAAIAPAHPTAASPGVGATPRATATATPTARVTVGGDVAGSAPAAGATVDLSRLTPVVAGASRGAVEGVNSGAPVGYIAFVALVAGLGAALWLRRRGDP